jgi:hypothetical protein
MLTDFVAKPIFTPVHHNRTRGIRHVVPYYPTSSYGASSLWPRIGVSKMDKIDSRSHGTGEKR